MATDNQRNSRRMQLLTDEYKRDCEQTDLPCWLCQQPIDYTGDGNTDDYAFHLDHYWPWSTHKELREDPDNFRPSHRLCNITRGDQPPRPPIGNTTRTWFTTTKH